MTLCPVVHTQTPASVNATKIAFVNNINNINELQEN